jgi:hypothetical protein
MVWNFNYIAITNVIENALILDSCGIQQIMIDTENLGKAERQSDKNAVINYHKIDDLRKIKNCDLRAKIICRINGYHSKINIEIENAIEAGADILMLPMIQNLKHFNCIVDQVHGRVEILPLIETPYSIFKLKEIIQITKPKQIHFGLNDLHLSLGMNNLFEVLLSPLFASAVSYSSDKVELVGIGGIGDPLIKQNVSPELLLKEYKRLGSQSVILSRNFFENGYLHSRIISSLNLFERLIANEQKEFENHDLIRQIERL